MWWGSEHRKVNAPHFRYSRYMRFAFLALEDSYVRLTSAQRSYRWLWKEGIELRADIINRHRSGRLNYDYSRAQRLCRE